MHASGMLSSGEELPNGMLLRNAKSTRFVLKERKHYNEHDDTERAATRSRNALMNARTGDDIDSMQAEAARSHLDNAVCAYLARRAYRQQTERGSAIETKCAGLRRLNAEAVAAVGAMEELLAQASVSQMFGVY